MFKTSSAFLALLFIPLISLAQPWQNKNAVTLKKIVLKEDSITSFIIKYYQPKLKETKASVPNGIFTKDTVEQEIYLYYFEQWYEDTNVYKHGLFRRHIPLKQEFIKGDLNGDGIEDIITSVYAMGDSRAEWTDIFLFLGTKQGYKFYDIYDSYKLGFCKNTNSKSGKFYAASIKNGLFIGQTNCFAHGDPGCCPSLECETAFKFVKGKFVVASQKLTVDRSPKN